MRTAIALLFFAGLSTHARGADRVVTNAVAQYVAYQYNGGVQTHSWQQGYLTYPAMNAMDAWQEVRSSPERDIQGYTYGMCGSGVIASIEIDISYAMAYQDDFGHTDPNGNQRQEARRVYSCGVGAPVVSSWYEGPVYFN